MNTQTPPLYDPANEHDSCGVGFVADLNGSASHRVIDMALEGLHNMSHRGALDADELTGDGTGILAQVPQVFFRDLYLADGAPSATEGLFGVAMIFHSRHDDHHARIRQLVESVLDRRGFENYRWRRVPVDYSVLGGKAASTLPAIYQIIVPLTKFPSALEADRALFIARKEIEFRATEEQLDDLYIASFSCRTILYKALVPPGKLAVFYPDLGDPKFVTRFAVFHQRYSTNTSPSWQLAHPFRMLAHNGEINTIVGNRKWSAARGAEIASPLYGEDARFLNPLIQRNGSDSANLDNALELLTISGRSLPHAVSMLLPEAWSADPFLDPDLRAFYEYHACINEPWDGPAAIVFSDGDHVGAALDRNGLRPVRYIVTQGGLVVLASEAGALQPANDPVIRRGRLGPGEIILADLKSGELIDDRHLKASLASLAPYREWVRDNLVKIPDATADTGIQTAAYEQPLIRQQLCFGYTNEEIDLILKPMLAESKEPTGSMGDDSALSVFSALPRTLSSYFKQLFAQVTNPPIDSIRERAFMSLRTNLGRRLNWLEETANHARQYQLTGPIISDSTLARLKETVPEHLVETLPILFGTEGGLGAMAETLGQICRTSEECADRGVEILILSDRGVNEHSAPIPILIAVAAVHNHLLRAGKRLKLSIVADSGEPRDVHHFATLLGYGASAINPYLVYRTIVSQCEEKNVKPEQLINATASFNKTINEGLLKVMAKAGISILGSYRGAQLFEAIGIGPDVIEKYFTGTPSRVGGIDLRHIAADALLRHHIAFDTSVDAALDDPGYYRFRKNGEVHAWSGEALRAMQDFRREGSMAEYHKFAIKANNHPPVALKDLLETRTGLAPISIDEVEPVEAILRRFTTAGMSLGSLSPETHEVLALAMNAIGGKSNTGEGGEDESRFARRADGRSSNSAIKQVASGRFGVTPSYLINAEEIEIKMAQGSKPGEGGQLPGHKVSPMIAALRRSQPGVTLISPPPHHDIYSIEDLAQLIYDLRQVNPAAKICVKLVSEAGIGTIAAGVAKAFADIILISGHEGGTGSSPLSSIKHAGSPWELGLAEAQQVLAMNGLRERVILRVDGGMKTGKDILTAAMLGAEEFNFGTAALIALGCKYVRQCHLNTCPVGIATQDERLRQKFEGTPEMLIAFLRAVAEDVRLRLASLGARTVQEVVGRADLLSMRVVENHVKAATLDLKRLLTPAPVNRTVLPVSALKRRLSLNDRILDDVRPAIFEALSARREYKISNVDRTIGARLAGEIAREHGDKGLPAGTIELSFRGSAGQSFGAFCISGMTLNLNGEANDYVGKGMAGGEINVSPYNDTKFNAHNVLAGNAILYGATGGSLSIAGSVGERFCVRNSGAKAVVEGIGDHGCEYMTNGEVAILGPTGINFGAGMTGGVAYVYAPDDTFLLRCNGAYVEPQRIGSRVDAESLRDLIEHHYTRTGSATAQTMLAEWQSVLTRFWIVRPRTADKLRVHSSGAVNPIVNQIRA